MATCADMQSHCYVSVQFLVVQNDEFQKEKLQEDYNDSYPFIHVHTTSGQKTLLPAVRIT